MKPNGDNSDLPGKLGCKCKMSKAKLEKLDKLCKQRRGKSKQLDEKNDAQDSEANTSNYDKFVKPGQY